MNIYVYLDPEYRDSLWFTQAFRAITEEAAKKKYAIRELACETLDGFDFDAFFGDEKQKIVMVLTTSVGKTEALLSEFHAHGIRVLFVNHKVSGGAVPSSNLIVDYADGMRKITEYLTSCQKTRPALFGINRNSATDMIKADYFRTFGCEAIYYNDSGLDRCFADMARHIENYDSFVAANDIVAYSLIHNLARIGIRVPEDVYLTSFGDSLLSQIGSPSLTTVAVDHEELGRQAVTAYSYLCKAGENIYLSAKVASTLKVRGSTAGKAPRETERRAVPVLHRVGVDFYHDEASRRLLHVEQTLTRCDRIDLQIISGLLCGVSYARLASSLFISENVVFYRIKRMVRAADVADRDALIALLGETLSPEAIDRYCKDPQDSDT